jgi:ArsR family transcriptional regulator
MQPPSTTHVAPLDDRARARFDARAGVVKALAHATRLALVDELSRGERCVCELHALVGGDLSTVSKHLAVLRAAGVVVDDKRGQQVFYRLRVPCITSFFSCVERVLRATAEDAAALLREGEGDDPA